MAADTFILGVGAMKAGTTWLFDYLSGFKEVAASPLKEVHYFDVIYREDLFYRRVQKNWDRLQKAMQGRKIYDHLDSSVIRAHIERLYMEYHPEAYLEHFRGLEGELTSHFCEITPSYSLLPLEGFKEIKKRFEDAGLKIKIVFLLRDPVDRHWSQIRFSMRKKGGGSVRDYFSTLEDSGWIERGRYDLTVERLNKVFGEDEVYIGFYENLFNVNEVRGLLNFLGLPDRANQAEIGKIVGRTDVREEMDDEFVVRATEIYKDVYDWCHSYFAGNVPQRWFRR